MDFVALYNYQWHCGRFSWQDMDVMEDSAVRLIVDAGITSPESLPGMAGLESERVKENSAELFLTDDLWRLVFAKLPVESLGNASVVNRQWHKIVQDPAVWATSFAAKWHLSALHGTPSSSNFWRGKLPQFAISHPLSRHDTVAGLAIKYNVQVIDIMRLNNMMSTHGVYSRQRLLIPVTSESHLRGCEGQIVKDECARREVVVVYPVGQKPDMGSVPENLEVESAVERAYQERMRRKVLETLRRSLRVDDSTISYYLSEANGDVRLACKLCLDDIRWNRSVRLSRSRVSSSAS